MLHPANTPAPGSPRGWSSCCWPTRTAGRRPRILVIGGGTVGDGLEELYADRAIDLLAFDVYASANVQLVGDGHPIPLADGTVDGVIIQAVLEHVLEPVVVAGEIHRVLREGGVVYADTPFMQQVHEGAYDFTRFTESGHRYLFRALRAGGERPGGGRRYVAALVGQLLRPGAHPLGRARPDRGPVRSSGSATSTGSSTRSTRSTAPTASTSWAARAAARSPRRQAIERYQGGM